MANLNPFTNLNARTSFAFVLRKTRWGCLFLLVTSATAFAQEKIKPVKSKSEPAITEKKVAVKNIVSTGCNYSKNQVDNTKGSVVKMMEREKFIAYTPDEMKEIFPDSDYITIEAYLNNFNNSIALLLKITIQTNSPQDTYGSIYKENKLLLKLTTGETITLLCGQSDAGNVDLTHIKTSYLTFFQLDDATMEKLKSAEVTMARLFWAKGYEDYKIINPDFFIRQITCVK